MGMVKKADVKLWLHYLLNKPLYFIHECGHTFISGTSENIDIFFNISIDLTTEWMVKLS